MGKWVIICNPKDYDIVGAFSEFNRINWKQSTNIEVGDIVYIYVGSPISSIKYETKAVQVELKKLTIDDTKYVIDDSRYKNHGRYIELELLRQFNDDLLPYNLLKKNGLKSVQGPCRISDELEKFILIKIKEDKKSRESFLDNSIIEEISDRSSELSSRKFEYNPEPKRRSEAITNNGNEFYPRDRQISINALNRAGNNCEIDENHPSFIRKNTNIKYAESHHLIPMAYQNMFENSLDIEANIISLCSNCHNQIHYGENSEELIKNLFEMRDSELKQAGIEISIDKLLDLYENL